MNTTSDPTVRLSIIVPAYNHCDDLARCLAALHAEVSPSSELIVVDDASTDATPHVAATGGAQVLRLEKNSGPGAARNLGAARAAGEVLLFVDADVVVAAGTLDRVIQCLRGRSRTGRTLRLLRRRPRGAVSRVPLSQSPPPLRPSGRRDRGGHVLGRSGRSQARGVLSPWAASTPRASRARPSRTSSWVIACGGPVIAFVSTRASRASI